MAGVLPAERRRWPVGSNYAEISEKIQKAGRKLLSEGKVERIIGFGRGEFTGEITPIFVTEPERAKELLFTPNAI